MKKLASKTTKRQQLVLRRETIIELTPLQLERIAGGWTWGAGNCVSQLDKLCVEDPI